MKGLVYNIRGKFDAEHVVIIWFVINFLSASFTQLYNDESYYTLFANQLALGYFDHPPMIALMIKAGSFLFKDEAGVRILSVASVSFALYLIYKLAGVNKPMLFLAAIFSVSGLNLLGFLALPDSPLLLFSIIFFLFYKRFLIRDSVPNMFLLGFAMAALLYSKYHGILVIFFTLLSNLNLLKSNRFRLSVLIGLFLFFPHIYWQYKNDFVSIIYHLFERSENHYKFSFTYEYLIGQILYYGPVTSIFMIIASVKYKISDLIDKALLWNLYGIFCFFLLGSLKGRVEVNWTLPAIIPMLIFFLKYSTSVSAFTRWFYYLSVPVILMIFILRLELSYPLINLKINRIDDLRGQKEFAKEVIDKSQGLPVITNRYQTAGILSFYTKVFTPSINVNGRRNQFSLWHADDSLRYRKVSFVNNYMNEGIKILSDSYKNYRVTVIDSLPVMNDLLISAGVRKIKVNQGGLIDIKVFLSADKPADNYRDAGRYKTRLSAGLYKDDNLMMEDVCPFPVDIILENNKGELYFHLQAPRETGKFKLIISLKTSDIGTWSTMKTVDLSVN
jgi:hypothetical protein